MGRQSHRAGSSTPELTGRGSARADLRPTCSTRDPPPPPHPATGVLQTAAIPHRPGATARSDTLPNAQGGSPSMRTRPAATQADDRRSWIPPRTARRMPPLARPGHSQSLSYHSPASSRSGSNDAVVTEPPVSRNEKTRSRRTPVNDQTICTCTRVITLWLLLLALHRHD